jgi:hypothetical protein
MKKIKIIALILITALFTVLAFSCSDEAGAAELGPGSISGNVFTDDYFKLEVAIPDIFTIEAMRDEEAKEAADMGMFMFFELSAETDYGGDYPDELAISATAMKLSAFESVLEGEVIKTEEDYLNYWIKDMRDYVSEISAVEQASIGGKTFYKAWSKSEYETLGLDGMISISEVYCYKQGDAFLIISAYYDEKGPGNYKTAADNFIKNNIKFK